LVALSFWGPPFLERRTWQVACTQPANVCGVTQPQATAGKSCLSKFHERGAGVVLHMPVVRTAWHYKLERNT